MLRETTDLRLLLGQVRGASEKGQVRGASEKGQVRGASEKGQMRGRRAYLIEE